jgi:hypothetical protein
MEASHALMVGHDANIKPVNNSDQSEVAMPMRRFNPAASTGQGDRTADYLTQMLMLNLSIIR